jgi:dihydroneopterin aldolase
MDIIYITDLRADAVIGVFDWERRIRQTLSFDIELGTDIRKAAATDALDDTVNYKAVARRVCAFVEQSGFQLVETLAERLAQLILDEFGVAWIRLRVNKAGAVRHARDVGVTIERGTRPQ